MSLDVDGNYFLIHHTPADTIDKIDPMDMARASAAIAVMTYVDRRHAREAEVDQLRLSTPKPQLPEESEPVDQNTLGVGGLELGVDNV